MNARVRPRLCRIVFLACLLAAGLATLPTEASISASLTLEPGPWVSVDPGGTALFDVYLRGYAPDDPSHPIISFALDLAASDPALTGAGANFSGFGFTLDPGLSGILSLAFDGDITDDGRVEYGADLPPFGTEMGILQSMGDTRLGTLSVDAPTTLGFYEVAFEVNLIFPASATFLTVDLLDFPPTLPTLPGNGDLLVTNSGINVIPEPGSAVVWVMVVVVVLAYQRRRQKRHSQALD